MEMSQTDGQALLILTNLPDEASARDLATSAGEPTPGGLRERAGALPFGVSLAGRHRERPGSSFADQDHGKRAMRIWKRRSVPAHPYELPEIIAVPIAHGLPGVPETGSLRRNSCRTHRREPRPDDDPPACSCCSSRFTGMARGEEPLPPEQAFRFSARVNRFRRPLKHAGRSPTAITCTATSSSSCWKAVPLGTPKLPAGQAQGRRDLRQSRNLSQGSENPAPGRCHPAPLRSRRSPRGAGTVVSATRR
jgi:hypothetical protein